MKVIARTGVLLVAALLLAAGSAGAAGVRTGFIVSNPQIFPVGDLVDVETIENSENFDWGSLPDMVFFEIFTTTGDAELDREVVFHLNLQFSGVELIDYWSSSFPLRNWIESPYGRNGYFTNTELGQLQENASDWLNENDQRRAYYADAEDFLSILDGANVRAGVAVVRIELYDSPGDDVIGNMIDSYTQTTQVFNPSPPLLQQPEDLEVLSGYPIYFSWNWYGGPVSTQDIVMIIVEGEPGEDGETAIQSRNPSKVRFEGHPQFIDSHTYTGISGDEQPFENGKTYFWQISLAAGTPIPGDTKEFESNVYSFSFEATGTSSPESGPPEEGTDPIFTQLALVLPPEVITGLTDELQGFRVQDISVDGVSGYRAEDLMQELDPQSGEVYSVTVE